MVSAFRGRGDKDEALSLLCCLRLSTGPLSFNNHSIGREEFGERNLDGGALLHHGVEDDGASC